MSKERPSVPVREIRRGRRKGERMTKKRLEPKPSNRPASAEEVIKFQEEIRKKAGVRAMRTVERNEKRKARSSNPPQEKH